MDLAWSSAKPTAAILFIHGGSLQESGERRSSPEYRDVCAPFVADGFACATTDYRLAPSHKWPAMPNDVATALSHFREKLRTRGDTATKLFLFGHSSGCHLAAILGTNPAYLHTVQMKLSDIAGVIAMGCLLDFDDQSVRRSSGAEIQARIAREPQDIATYGSAENYLSANPMLFTGPRLPPFLVVVAESERFMPPILEQGSRFVRRLLENEVPAELVIVPGRHMSSIANISRAGDPTYRAIREFITAQGAIGRKK
jgi:acetyl esterase/lipase